MFYPLLYSDGESVEFVVEESDGRPGKRFASAVTGIDGAPVKGAGPRPDKRRPNSDFDNY